MTTFDDAVEAMCEEAAKIPPFVDREGAMDALLHAALPVIAQALRDEGLPPGYADPKRPGLHAAADFVEGLGK